MELRKVCELIPHEMNRKIYGSEDIPEAFIESIKQKGILTPLVIKTDNIIISGHRRWRIAKAIGLELVPVRTVHFKNELEEREAIIDFNRQREKTFSQKMAEADELKSIEAERARQRRIACLQQYDKKPVVENFPQRKSGKTRDKVAATIGFGSGRNYAKAAKVWNEAKAGNSSAQIKVVQIDRGEISIHKAYNDICREEKRLRLNKELKARPLPKGKFNVILADPPWEYEFTKTKSRAIENHYPTMNLETIKSLNIPSADNSILFLWATAPKLEEALEVMRAWNFKYRTCAVWDKEVIGMGYWFRSQHEHLLVGVKGKFHPPAEDKRISSVFREKRTKHSKKPEFIYNLIESMFPGGKCLELFARQKHSEVWEVWGNEV